ncbi:leucyl/phenylalanyl-tRNA--protein transferase [Chitinophaga skermanii]|uniref:Leucyl/phenylalanyl-tRNA--protein transferase n=1 Tax=Chitinophaga skermanii TaxID=331697 RepID=A0A327Q821_9BACT|nr:leucyl/phenylalanyl-tRNA--protein transferase [Chitinophaga skermanii]RAI99402.1 leucyl/phenylalanyl-tRNA--protein transferase [Chitinophaga skermanii]
MPIFTLHPSTLLFPPVHLAEDDGLLAVGGDLTPGRLLLAYQSGIFPWFGDDEPIMWWSPDPRFVLFPQEIYISKSMRQVLKRNTFNITINQCFEEVIKQCSLKERPGQDSTWITQEMQAAYKTLHNMGFALSVEAWQNGQLVGGLYGVKIGDCFFGESMFAHVSNASKAAFITFVEMAAEQGLQIIDCQVHTEHLASLGARFIDRADFISIIKKNMHL